MEATRHNTRAAELDLDNVVQDVVLGVEEAYFNLLAARELLEVNRQTVERARAHVELASGFVEVGRRPRFDLTKAQVDLSNAQVSLIQARNALEVARVVLANALGLEGELPSDPSERPASTPPELTREQAIQLGLTSRRDLASTTEKLSAARASLGSARAGYRPVVSVATGRTLRGETYPLDRQADLSFSLDWNLFDGHLTKAAVAEARAQTEVLQGQLDTLRQKVVADVQKNYLDMVEAQARVQATRISLTQARENLELAQGRYSEGVGSPIEVTDAELSLTSAESARVSAQYDYEIALARLQRSTGQIRTEVRP
jgi:outer membrane protein TolC